MLGKTSMADVSSNRRAKINRKTISIVQAPNYGPVCRLRSMGRGVDHDIGKGGRPATYLEDGPVWLFRPLVLIVNDYLIDICRSNLGTAFGTTSREELLPNPLYFQRNWR